MSTVNKTLPERLQRRTTAASDIDTPAGYLVTGTLRGSSGGLAGGFLYSIGIACGFWNPAIDIMGATMAVLLASTALGGMAGWLGAAFTGDNTTGLSRSVGAL